jgi:predicted Zn-dependent peptidase
MYKKTILNNGLRIITVPQEQSQTATVLVLVGTGSKYEKKEVSGISHFLEHMLLKGTAKRPTEMDIFGAIDGIGGAFNAFTGEDFTGYYAKVQSSKFEFAFDWVSDIFLNATLPAEEIEKERGAIIEEINMFYDHPMRYIWDLWNEVLYGDQPAGWNIAGTKETVSNIKRGDLASYRKSQYVASDTIVCISGNFKEEEAIALAQKYFSGISSSNPFPKPAVLESQKNPEVLVRYKDNSQTQIALGVRTYSHSHPRKYALEMLNSVLGGMASSRLMEEIRIKRGLAYDVHTENIMNSDTGSLVVSANLDTSRLQEGLKVVLAEFKKIAEAKISGEELKKAKDNYIGRNSIALESSHALASFYAEQELLEGEILTPEEIFAKINSVTAEEILAVARDIFKPEKLNLALIGPFQEKEEFINLLNSNL